MRRAMWAAVAAVGLLVAGCGSSGVEVESDPEAETPTVEATHRSDEPTSSPAATESASPEEPEEEAAQGPEESDRGYIIKTVGETGGYYDTDSQPIFEFVMTDLVPDFKCTYPDPDPTQNGQRLGMRFEVETTADLPELGVDSMLMSMHDFLVWDDQGSRVNDTISGVLLCLTDGDRLPNPIGPGESVNGWVVVDVPPGGGTVAYAPFGPGGGGWEWEYEG